MNDSTSLRDLFSGTTGKVSSLLLAAVLVFSVLAGGFTGAATASSHDFEVNVTDSADGTAIANASVDVINSSDGTVVASGTTDSNGQFTANVNSGTYDVVVNADGYHQATANSIDHTSGTLSQVDLPLNRQTGTIESTVSDAADGSLIENATVEVVDPNDGSVVMTATTDSNGFVSMTGVPTGTYTLTASADGYQTGTNTGVSVTSGNVTVSDFGLAASDTTVSNEFAVNTSEGTPDSLYAELENGTYTVTWYEVDSNGNRTDLNTDSVTISDGPTVHEFAPSNFSEASDGATYGVEITFNSGDSPDAAVVSSGILYDGGGGGGGDSDGSSPFDSLSTEVIGGAALIAVLVGAVALAGRD